ncbi:MAG: PTS sugar transporter subunit IIB [Mycoplasmatales bacterium]
MKNIYLFCDAGMSTSLMVSKMQKAAEEKGSDVHIEAFSLNTLKENGPKADVLLLGPQVRFREAEVKEQFPDKPMFVIDMQQYGMMQGDKVLDQALELV